MVVFKVIDEGKSINYCKSDNCIDVIIDLVYYDGKLYIVGLFNEEFVFVLWVVDFFFGKKV